ncbi:glutamate 5-kinase [Puniceicoccales bacterium CK1056]|uniref:Glutamate 5-kinase n=1 Tax=Oceanipulchritudo coccoides TaxID=2706888 RepID=A0A6B2M014_9BACT|nr:glutamate 5-kinase [Oceanipulchritudo coccoides]NDV62258.1 glutamate 5-kinase [Oceanipulchritudo coccoides]
MQFLEANARRVVIKIGTNSLTGPGGDLLSGRIEAVCREISSLKEHGFEVVVVSSGAVGLGIGKLELTDRPDDLAGLQACAAVGQSCLMQAWQAALQTHQITAAQILLTREDVQGRKRHLAVRNTLEELLSYGAVPVVNENDTVSADEIKFGDNDVLSALVASLIKADLLIILSNIPGLMKDHGRGALIPLVEEVTEDIRELAGGPENQFSTGGMITKIEAAKLATQSGCGVFIGSANEPGIIGKVHDGTAPGTFFMPQTISLAARKRWIAFFEKPMGSLHLDAGAARAILENHSSLLAKGLLSCTGSFEQGAVVNLLDPDSNTIARGIVAYDAATLSGIIGLDSSQIQKTQPERSRFEVVHRDSLVLI